MAENERLEKLESAIRKTQDSMLLMSKDIHQMNNSIQSVAKSMEVLVKVQQDLRIMEERNDTRHLQLKEADRVIHARIDNLNREEKDIEIKANNGNRAYSVLLWTAKILGASALTLFFGLMVYLIQLKG